MPLINEILPKLKDRVIKASVFLVSKEVTNQVRTDMKI